MTTSQGLSRCSLDLVCPFLAPKMVPTFQLEENIDAEPAVCQVKYPGFEKLNNPPHGGAHFIVRPT